MLAEELRLRAQFQMLPERRRPSARNLFDMYVNGRCG
jgi:hypothetical protein